LKRQHRDIRGEPGEIGDVVGEQVSDTVGLHGGDDIGIVDLLATSLNLLMSASRGWSR
jgi:hypothetical protein